MKKYIIAVSIILVIVIISAALIIGAVGGAGNGDEASSSSSTSASTSAQGSTTSSDEKPNVHEHIFDENDMCECGEIYDIEDYFTFTLQSSESYKLTSCKQVFTNMKIPSEYKGKPVA